MQLILIIITVLVKNELYVELLNEKIYTSNSNWYLTKLNVYNNLDNVFYLKGCQNHYRKKIILKIYFHYE